MKKSVLLPFLAALVLRGASAAPVSPKPGAPPPAEETLKREERALGSAAKSLLDFAAKAEKAGAGAAAAKATELAARLYPGDLELAALRERRNSLESGELPAPLEAERARAFKAAGVALAAWGDWLARLDSPAVADWAYGLAMDLGEPVGGKREALGPALEARGRACEAATGPASRDAGWARCKAACTGYEFVYTLPQGWNPDRSWPVVLAPHGTEPGWGRTEQDELFQLDYYQAFTRASFLVASYRDPVMFAGQLPDEAKAVATLLEIVDFLALHYRVHARQVFVGGRGSGALPCWALLQAGPGRLAGVEIHMGKFDGLPRVKAGSAACAVPVRIGIRLSDDPEKVTGGVKQKDFDAVHVGMMQNARRTMERLKFSRLEWVDSEKFDGLDVAWHQARLEERTPCFLKPVGKMTR